MSEPSDSPPGPPDSPPASAAPGLSPAVDSQLNADSAGLNRLHGLWILAVRLMILGLSVSLGWLAGVLVAQIWPARSPEPPLQERLMRQSSQTWRKVKQLPQWWQHQEPRAIAPPAPRPESWTTPESAPLPPLSATAQQQLQTELSALQKDWQALTTRLAELESQAGLSPTGSLESRLEKLGQRAGGATGQAASSASTSTPTEPTVQPPPPAVDGLGSTAAMPYQEPLFPLIRDRIVLPSALLFEPDSSSLTASGQQLLNAIVPDLGRYGAVTLLVGSHTDGPLAADQARQLTFQQALAVQRHLKPQLDPVGIRWITLGYGKTRPLAVGTAPGTQLRNQRLEIGLVPQP